MLPEKIYEAVKDLTPYQVKKWYADNNISNEDKQAYKNYKNVKSVLKSRQKNIELYNTYQNKLMKERRQANRNADNVKQRQYNKTYRDKIKKEGVEIKKKQDVNDILNDIINDVVNKSEKNKAVATLTNAIKRKTAMQKLNNKKTVQKLQDKIKEVFNKPKEETPQEKMRRETRERVRKWRAKKRELEANKK